MRIFNSIGSNYTWSFALRALFTFGSDEDRKLLSAELSKRYGGKSYLIYKGREAIVSALKASNLPKGSKVIISGYTCSTVVVAVSYAGHEPIYTDVTPPLINFSPENLLETLKKYPDSRAVIIQNTLGYSCDIAGIKKICDERKMILIEDLAHSAGGTYSSGEVMGTVGDFVIFSFSQDKILDAVSGGALVIRNPIYKLEGDSSWINVPFAEQLRAKVYPFATCFIRSTHNIGIGKVVHRILFSLHLLAKPVNDLKNAPTHRIPGWCASLALSRLHELPATIAHRQEIVKKYLAVLGSRSDCVFIKDTFSHNACLRFPLVVDNRDALVAYLRTQGIHLSDIWYDVPVAPKRYWHLFESGHTETGARDLAKKSVNLPTHQEITPEIAEHIAKLVQIWITSPQNTSTTKGNGNGF